MGRPTKYRREMCEAVARSVPGGATWPAIAQECGVDRATVIAWDAKHPEFHDAVKAAKAAVDDSVELAMLEAARGRKKIDTTAALFWLCNRRPDRWRHVQRGEHTGEGGGAITIAELVRGASEG
jgi:transposase-like protein